MKMKMKKKMRWRCIEFNSCQTWIWFKWNSWKWFIKWKTFWSKNFNIDWNQNRLKWWKGKYFWFNSCQAWIWFEYNRLKWHTFFHKDKPVNWPMPVSKPNRIRNPGTQNLRIAQCTECNSIDWAACHNNSTFVQFCGVRIMNYLSQS
jgi:hypothetical protein